MTTRYPDRGEIYETTVVVCYSFDFDDRLFAVSPVIGMFPERGIYEIARAKRPDTQVIVVLPIAMSDAELEYYFRLYGLSSDASARVQIRVPLESSEPRGGSLASRLLQDEKTLHGIQLQSRSSKNIELSVYTPTHESAEVARLLNARLSEGLDYTEPVDFGKLTSKKLLQTAGVDIACGPLRKIVDMSDLLTVCASLVSGESDSFILKLDSGMWGSNFGNIVVRIDPESSLELSIDRALSVAGWSRSDFESAVEKYGCVVERFYSSSASLGCLGFIGRDGEIQTGRAYRQVLKSGKHVGSVFGGDEDWQSVAAGCTRSVADELWKLGYRGEFGVDFILRVDGSLTALEINLRKTGSLHAVRQLEILQERRMWAAEEEPSTEGPWSVYVQLDDEAFRDLDFDDLLDVVNLDSTLACTENSGVVFNVSGALKRYGYIDAVTYGPTEAHCWWLADRVRRVLDEASDMSRGRQHGAESLLPSNVDNPEVSV